MRGSLAGEHPPPRANTQVNHGQDQQVHEAAAKQVPRCQVDKSSSNSSDVNRQFRKRSNCCQQETAYEQPPDAGRLSDSIGRPCQQPTSCSNSRGKQQELEKEHERLTGVPWNGCTA